MRRTVFLQNIPKIALHEADHLQRLAELSQATVRLTSLHVIVHVTTCRQHKSPGASGLARYDSETYEIVRLLQ